MSRRTLLALAATIVAGCAKRSESSPSAATASSAPGTTRRTPPTSPSTEPPPTAPPTDPATTPPATPTPLAADPFTLGVTSGDPDQTSVVLWTRLLSPDLPAAVEVTWELADDETFATITATGTTGATVAHGHAVHVIAPLGAASWYRFRAGGFTSPAGRTSPAPSDPASLRLAAASCQHFETGFYAAHRDIAEWAPDIVVFLGDFIYEGAASPVGGEIVRAHEGPEPTTLDAYRNRYATYLADPELRASRAACPWVVIWDDHEVENNYAAGVPQDPVDGATFAARRDAAYQAWWEHMPVRLPAPTAGRPFAIERAVRWGHLVDLILLDGRQFRSDQACGSPTLSLDPPCPEAADATRTMLGAAQETWLAETLSTSTAIWPAVCQQTVLTDLRFNGAILNYDQWDGYDPARQRLLAAAAAAPRTVVLTGDIHLAGVGLLPGVGVEFVTTAISSVANVDASLQPILDSFTTVVGSELVHRGYTRHTVTAERWVADYRMVGDVHDPASPVTTWQTFTVDASTRDMVTVG